MSRRSGSRGSVKGGGSGSRGSVKGGGRGSQKDSKGEFQVAFERTWQKCVEDYLEENKNDKVPLLPSTRSPP